MVVLDLNEWKNTHITCSSAKAKITKIQQIDIEDTMREFERFESSQAKTFQSFAQNRPQTPNMLLQTPLSKTKNKVKQLAPLWPSAGSTTTPHGVCRPAISLVAVDLPLPCCLLPDLVAGSSECRPVLLLPHPPGAAAATAAAYVF